MLSPTFVLISSNGRHYPGTAPIAVLIGNTVNPNHLYVARDQQILQAPGVWHPWCLD